jgi:hypothetical protein
VTEPVVPPANDSEPREVLELVHHHPGRLRVRAAALRGDDPRVERATEALQAIPGITRVDHSARTGSILVEYEPGHAEPHAIVERMAQAAGLMSPFDPRAMKPRFVPSDALIDGARGLNSITNELTGRRTDLRTLVPAAMAGAAVYSFLYGQGPRLPRWDNLLYWSYSIFSALHSKEIHDVTGAVATTPDGGAES